MTEKLKDHETLGLRLSMWILDRVDGILAAHRDKAPHQSFSRSSVIRELILEALKARGHKP